MYNPCNFEAIFTESLQTAGMHPSSLRNYRSDFRHFWGWLLVILRRDEIVFDEHRPTILTHITLARITEYKAFLLENATPAATINRRLATIRKFLTLCQARHWISANPAIHVHNVSLPPQKQPITQEQVQTVLDEYAQYLTTQTKTKHTKRGYVSDVRDFLNWTVSRQT